MYSASSSMKRYVWYQNVSAYETDLAHWGSSLWFIGGFYYHYCCSGRNASELNKLELIQLFLLFKRMRKVIKDGTSSVALLDTGWKTEDALLSEGCRVTHVCPVCLKEWKLSLFSASCRPVGGPQRGFAAEVYEDICFCCDCSPERVCHRGFTINAS